MDVTPKTPSKRMFSLDILRGSACCLVLLTHMPVDYDSLNPVVAQVVSAIRRPGWLGVDLFFVLSGLLISGLLFHEIKTSGSVNYWRFWLRRGLKIWPSYFIAFGGMLAAIVLVGHPSTKTVRQSYESILPNSIFIQNYVECWVWPHTWTIAIEEHFYALLPLALIALIAIKRLRWLPGAIACICIVDLGLRLWATANGADWEAIKYPTHLHVDALLFGVLLGYLFAYHPEKLEWLRPWWPAAIAGTIAVLATTKIILVKEHPFFYATLFTPIYLVFGALVALARLNPTWGTKGPLLFRAATASVAFIGTYSYTIYVMHGVISKLPYIKNMRNWFSQPMVAPCLFLALSILSGIALSHLVERPFLRLRDRWIPSASKSQPRASLTVAADTVPNSQSPAVPPKRRAA